MTSAASFAMIAGWREDLRRARLALEACEVVGQTLAAVLAPPTLPYPSAEGLIEIDRTHSRPPAAIAEALVGYLKRGGRLDPDLSRELAILLNARRSPISGDDEPA